MSSKAASLSPREPRSWASKAARSIELLAALGAATSGCLHLLSFLQHSSGSIISSLVIGLMALGCLWCALDLLRRPALKVWFTIALMNAAMIITHQLIGTTGSGNNHMSHMSMTHEMDSSEGMALMDVAVLCAGAELLLAVAVIFVATRRYRPAGSPTAEPEPADTARQAR